MLKLVTAAQMREIDRRTIEEGGVPGLLLMENAGRAVAQRARQMLGRPHGRQVVVICGRGNNGGDGFVVARCLQEWGAECQVFLAAEEGEISGDALANLQRMKATGLQPRPVDDLSLLEAACRRAALIVDALLGTGIRGELTGRSRELIELINRAGRRVLAVDLPSGLNADTGRPAGACVRAAATVTMGLVKFGLAVYPGAELAGELEVAEIGIPPHLVEELQPEAELLQEEDAARLLPVRPPDSNKGDFGRVLVVAGSRGMTGAAALAAESALRAGAGLVYLACPASLNEILEIKATEVITRPAPETDQASFSLEALDHLEELAGPCQVVAIGPGLSRHPQTQELACRLADRMNRLGKRLIVDADGLNALVSKEFCFNAPERVVCSPHPGEAARLLHTSVPEVQADRPGAVRELAKRMGATVVLKGAASLIAQPDGRLRVNPTGNPGMATAGAGDVLTGMAAALLAQGLPGWEAASLAVFAHGLAGDLAAADLSERGMLAGDVMDRLPAAWKKLESRSAGRQQHPAKSRQETQD